MSRRLRPVDESVERYASMLGAMGTAARLRILRLLLAAHPDGMVVGEIIDELGMSASTLSHHLDKLKQEQLVTAERQGTYLRYRANASVLQELLAFVYAECCTRNTVVDPHQVTAPTRTRRGSTG